MTTDDALTAALEISEMILRSNSIPDGEPTDTDLDMIFADQRDAYAALRTMLYERKIGTDTREGMLINNMLDIADDHFDF